MAKFSDAQFHAIIAGKRHFNTYPFPGSDLRVAVRVLTEAELDECRAAGQHEVRELAKKRGWKAADALDVDPELMHRAIERMIVFRAFFDVDTVGSDDPARFFQTPDEVRALDSVTMTMCGRLYLEHQEWCSPALHLSDSDVEELVTGLGKSQAPEVFLGVYAPSTLRRFVISLASRVRTST